MNDKDLEMFDDIDLDDIDLDDIEISDNNNEVIDVEIQDETEESTEEQQDSSEEVEVDDDLQSLMNEIENTSKKKKKETKKKAVDKPKEEPKKKYEGPRHIKVYGEELWVEDDPNVTEEEIRQRIVNEFGFGEFRKDKTIFDLDEETGILDVAKQYQKKG